MIRRSGCRGTVGAGLFVLLFGAACTADERTVTVIEPTALRHADGPWADDEPSPDDHFNGLIVPSGDDEALVARWRFAEPAEFAVGDLAGEWRDVEGLPDTDEVAFLSRAGPDTAALETATIDGDVYLVGGRCGEFNLAEEEYAACSDARAFEVWRLPAGAHAWDEVLSLPFEEVAGTPEWFDSDVLGVADGRIIVELGTAAADEPLLVALDPESKTFETIGRSATEDDYIHPLCVTQSGTVAGAGMSELWRNDPEAAMRAEQEAGVALMGGDRSDDPVRGRLATLEPGGDWVHHEDIAFE